MSHRSRAGGSRSGKTRVLSTGWRGAWYLNWSSGLLGACIRLYGRNSRTNYVKICLCAWPIRLQSNSNSATNFWMSWPDPLYESKLKDYPEKLQPNVTQMPRLKHRSTSDNLTTHLGRTVLGQLQQPPPRTPGNQSTVPNRACSHGARTQLIQLSVGWCNPLVC